MRYYLWDRHQGTCVSMATTMLSLIRAKNTFLWISLEWYFRIWWYWYEMKAYDFLDHVIDDLCKWANLHINYDVIINIYIQILWSMSKARGSLGKVYCTLSTTRRVWYQIKAGDSGIQVLLVPIWNCGIPFMVDALVAMETIFSLNGSLLFRV